jgi:hypothetical protein
MRRRSPIWKTAYDEAVRRAGSAVGTAVFLVVAPGTTAILISWLMTGWDGRVPPLPAAIRLVGLALVILGTVVLLSAFARFVAEGRGTPAPVAPTERLVVGGLYRFVRNPMYLAVAATNRRPGADPRQARTPDLRGRLPAHHGRVRPRLRGADAPRAVRSRVRGVSTIRAGMVAASPALEPVGGSLIGTSRASTSGDRASVVSAGEGSATSSSVGPGPAGPGSRRPRW